MDKPAFRPDWISSPGDTIQDILAERGMSINALASQLGQSVDQARSLLSGQSAITLAIARILAKRLGASVEFWMLRDYQYREQAAHLTDMERRWVDKVPIAEIVRFGWMDSRPHPGHELEACLDFFGVTTIHEWRLQYGSIEGAAAYRTSMTFESDPVALAAWLRQGEREASAIITEEWQPEKFKQSLWGIRSLTRTKDPVRFLPELKEICASCGVAVVVVRALSDCKASGAARFVRGNKAILQLSFRYLSDDHFWFTFFHEAGHLLLHSKARLFLEGVELSTEEEAEANEFAQDILIPPHEREEFECLTPSHRAIMAFARRIGIAPGIVVGQLQHEERIPRAWLNRLKRRYEWSTIEG